MITQGSCQRYEVTLRKVKSLGHGQSSKLAELNFQPNHCVWVPRVLAPVPDISFVFLHRSHFQLRISCQNSWLTSCFLTIWLAELLWTKGKTKCPWCGAEGISARPLGRPLLTSGAWRDSALITFHVYQGMSTSPSGSSHEELPGEVVVGMWHLFLHSQSDKAVTDKERRFHNYILQEPTSIWVSREVSVYVQIIICTLSPL